MMPTGMVNRIGEKTVDSEALERRLTSLSNFQAMLLRHALSFPSVRRVVYSTCSVHERENELVVHDVLQSTSSEFQLVDILPGFPGRGKSSTLLQAKSCVRMSPETSLTVGFFVACLECVDEVPDHWPSSSKLEFGVQKEEGVTVSESTACEMQTECDAVGERRKSHKRKKSKKEKTAKLEYSELDDAVVKEGSSSELDGPQQNSRSKSLSFVSEPTTGTVATVTAGECSKSHKRKKSKREKAAKLARLECCESETGLESLDHGQGLPDLPTSAAKQTEEVTATDSKKLHKRKKSKKQKARLECCTETDATTGLESLDHGQNLPDLPSSAVKQTEEVTATDSKKLNKRKKSKKRKARLECCTETDTTTGLESHDHGQSFSDLSSSAAKLTEQVEVTGVDSKKLHKREKLKKEKATSVVEQSEVDTTAVLERLNSVQNSSDLLPTSTSMQTEQLTAANCEKSHKHKKSKKEKAKIDTILVRERLHSKFDSQTRCCFTESTESTIGVMQAEHVGESGKLHRHEKSKKEKAAKFYQT